MLIWRILAAVMLLTAAIAVSMTGQSRGLVRGHGGTYVQASIHSVTFGTPFQYNLNNYPTHMGRGDGMSTTWADDDQLYINTDDTPAGWDDAVANGRNTMMGKITTYDTTAIASNWNTMDAWSGASGWSFCASDNRSHKIAGVISVQGVMYALAWRLSCVGNLGGASGQLLKSTDHAASWSPVPPSGAAPYASPMWPGTKFPMGFIQYGKDYSGAGPDNSANYVYALAIDDAKLAGSRADEWLGRCLISNLGNLNAADWTWWQGGDGMQDGNWGPLSTAASLAHITTIAGQTGIYYWNVVYLPLYQQYLAINNTDISSGPFTWVPYIAPHPWGPWTALAGTQFTTYQNSFPNPITKSLVTDGGHTMWIFGSGNTNSQDPHTGYYTLWIVPATVN